MTIIRAPVLLFLISCMMLDLKDRRVPNDYLLVNTVILAGYGLLRLFSTDHMPGEILSEALPRMKGILILFPIALLMHALHLFGGADLKVFLLLSLLYSLRTVLILFTGSVILSAIGGVCYLLFSGRVKDLLRNYREMFSAFVRKGKVLSGREHFHRFPYLVAITASFLCLMISGNVR